MKLPESSPAGTKLVAGVLCLDFVNTADWHASDRPVELLRSYQDLVSWSRRAGLTSAADARRRLNRSHRHPHEAAQVLTRAIALREALYRIVVAQLRGPAAAAADLELFNGELSSALRRLRLVQESRGMTWEWESGREALDGMLWPILRSAAELLTSEKRERIGQCADDRGCGWLFLDTSRNGRRRWCEMEDCGNRAKARRHYRRSRERARQGRCD